MLGSSVGIRLHGRWFCFLLSTHKAKRVMQSFTFFARNYRYDRWATGQWCFGVNALLVNFWWVSLLLFFFFFLKVTKTSKCNEGVRFRWGKKCAKSALKQSDSVAKNLNVQGTEMYGSHHRRRQCRPSFQPTVCTRHYGWDWRATPSAWGQPPQSGRNMGYLGKNSIRITCGEKTQHVGLP